ncbi:HCP-like protein [Suhomyces tanzawaensis NRRL Y-17324]|uniref:HCP-like protein n=1 Tax=Suhomyces tanzawaensis NRRL Y-17324 TaxID=984487 RepID=A0A1E4SEM6_9ASCO|nr:HCP-like protein [Suhomyces tanzawaensis NRRL Y-17324]ODV77930.1 HCP-like protein [Suhomyces tanzawaensis NRRL Y-17324]
MNPGVAGAGVPSSKSQDPIINTKIAEFTRLRKIIASGNKSIEYRLRWVKMLMTATNFKLYAYINIKGEPIPPEQAAFNKTLFVKSSVTHLVKLLREFEAGKDRHLDVKHEVYFIYACLLKSDYHTSYNQDFGIPKNIPGAVEYFEKCLELHPTDFKTMYKLGDIYEYELDQFDRALEYYKQSAKGYNRAIYKISLLYLNVPEIRNIKFLRYLEDLSNIDPLDIRLDPEDKEDLEEVIGLACYQLGRVYEGIYPGDLTSNDEFVQRALELAPVNYAKSLTYYNKSAKLNCLLAQVKLGLIYEFGELNRPQNANKSIQWYLRAASSPLPFKRHPDAMLGLSRWNVIGSQGVSKHVPMPNPDKAVMWCDRAFKEFGSADAAFYMGELTEMGVCPGDPTPWYTRAYEMGHPEASAKLGFA